VRVLLDTNIVGRQSQPSHQLHSIVVAAIKQLGGAGHELFLVPQVLYEFWTIATRPEIENGLGFSPVEARRRLLQMIDVYPLLTNDEHLWSVWLELVTQHDVRGKLAHDARLVAAMKCHQLSHLLTLNPADFRRYAAIQILDPRSLTIDGKA
jgi:predicted nucleic acid-binding protein